MSNTSESQTEVPEEGSVAEKRLNYRAAHIWGNRLLSKGWTGVAHLFFELYPKLNVTPQEALFLLNLTTYHSLNRKAGSLPYPSITTLGERLGVDKRRARVIAQNLEEKGLIKRVYRPRHSERSETNLWDLQPLMKKLEVLALDLTPTSERASEKEAEERVPY